VTDKHEHIRIPDQYVRNYERLLVGGVWAQVDMRFESNQEAREEGIELGKLKVPVTAMRGSDACTRPREGEALTGDFRRFRSGRR